MFKSRLYPINKVVRSLIKKRNSAGQATVEYILLIVIVVAIALAVKGPLGERLGEFSGKMVGEDGYYACLMERGYLPEDPRASECGKYKLEAEGSLQGGSGGSGGSGSGGGSGDSGGSRSFGNSGNSAGDSDSSSREDLSADGNSGSDGALGSSSGSSYTPGSFRLGKKSGSGKGGSDSLTGGGDAESFLANPSFGEDLEGEEDDEGNSRSLAQNQSGNFDVNKTGYKSSRFPARGSGDTGYADTLYDEDPSKKKTFKAEEIAESGGGAGSGGQEESGKNKAIKEGQKKAEESSDKPKRWNFLAFIKYFLIAGLIILLLAIVFSQVMEYQGRD